jgi:hypothetical protein
LRGLEKEKERKKKEKKRERGREKDVRKYGDCLGLFRSLLSLLLLYHSGLRSVAALCSVRPEDSQVMVGDQLR